MYWVSKFTMLLDFVLTKDSKNFSILYPYTFTEHHFFYYFGADFKSKMEEAEIVKLLAFGDEKAYEQLFKLYYRQLTLFASKYVNDIDLSRDIVQEVFVQLFDKRESIQIHTSLKSFLFQMVRNRCINHIKLTKIHSTHHDKILALTDLAPIPFNELEAVELADRIALLVSQMPAQTKKVFEMSRFDGVPNQDIALELQISKRTVETHISNALKKLREGLVDVLGFWFCFIFFDKFF